MKDDYTVDIADVQASVTQPPNKGGGGSTVHNIFTFGPVPTGQLWIVTRAILATSDDSVGGFNPQHENNISFYIYGGDFVAFVNGGPYAPVDIGPGYTSRLDPNAGFTINDWYQAFEWQEGLVIPEGQSLLVNWEGLPNDYTVSCTLTYDVAHFTPPG